MALDKWGPRLDREASAYGLDVSFQPAWPHPASRQKRALRTSCSSSRPHWFRPDGSLREQPHRDADTFDNLAEEWLASSTACTRRRSVRRPLVHHHRPTMPPMPCPASPRVRPASPAATVTSRSRTGSCRRILLQHGYNTFALGKWASRGPHRSSPAGPTTPLGAGPRVRAVLRVLGADLPATPWTNLRQPLR